MTYAQICKACKEVFVLQERAVSCPSCAAPMPEPKAKEGAQVVPANPKQWTTCTWQDWKDSEPKNPNIRTDRQWQDNVSCKIEPSSDVIAEFLQINEEIAGLYNLLYGFMSKNTKGIQASKNGGKGAMSYGDLCDFGFFCREAENTLDELRKEVKARKELCGQVIAMRKTEESLSDPNIKLKVAGQYATGSPDVKMQAQQPTFKLGEPNVDYYKLTDYFKVPREVAATGIFRLSWKATGDFITQLAADGHKPPDGFGKQYPAYVTTFRRKRRAK